MAQLAAIKIPAWVFQNTGIFIFRSSMLNNSAAAGSTNKNDARRIAKGDRGGDLSA